MTTAAVPASFLGPAGDPELAESTFVAQHRGDVLRNKRSLHPIPDRFQHVVEAEEAVARTALLLENLAREHQANLARLDRARAALGLGPAVLPLQEPPASREAVARLAPVPATPFATEPVYCDVTGRIVARQRMTLLTKTAGKLLLASGQTLAWVASASYVDALEELFDGAPIVARVTMRPAGQAVIQAVRPATREEWGVDEFDFAAYAGFGPATVTERLALKKKLAEANGRTCSVCGLDLLKLTDACLAGNPEPVLMCRPCKEDWKDTVRQPGTAEVTV